MVAVTRFDVTAKRWERGWELHIDGVGVTQSRTLRDAEAMIRSYLALDLGDAIAEHSEVHVTVQVDGMREVEKVRKEIDRLAEQQRRVARDSRALAKRLKAAGLTGADAAHVMGVSEQRFSQLLNA